jgi:ElaB/YqjD/DUF883 family membrane-anchored ribosome-binding protein
MQRQRQAISNDLGRLADDARALVVATADVAGDKVSEARKRLSEALENGKELYGRVRDRAVDRAKATDLIVRDHPYQAIGIAIGFGALIGLVIARQCARNNE